MSVKNDYLGLIFASMHDKEVHDLTRKRTMGSIPFGGRYRLIDFPLSNFVNSGISDVGIITKANYGSLLDHVGSGRDWDLARKRHGLRLMPPYVQGDENGQYKGRLDALANIWPLINHSDAKYIICTNCDIITAINFDPIIRRHTESKADITLIYQKAPYCREKDYGATILDLDENGRLRDVSVSPDVTGEQNIWLEMFVIEKALLQRIVQDKDRLKNDFSFTKFILKERNDNLRILGYEHKARFMRINNIENYYKANMMLLDSNVRDQMFPKDHPVYTKVGDSAPTKYGQYAKVRNSLIADGCRIEGTVENSILFRGVQVGAGTVVKDSIIMQGTTIADNVNVISTITDKNVTINGNSMPRDPEHDIKYLHKGSEVVAETPKE